MPWVDRIGLAVAIPASVVIMTSVKIRIAIFLMRSSRFGNNRNIACL
jgi:hypothetical protein